MKCFLVYRLLRRLGLGLCPAWRMAQIISSGGAIPQAPRSPQETHE
jgi:hypothetical protein